jgi:hypothetical protein
VEVIPLPIPWSRYLAGAVIWAVLAIAAFALLGTIPGVIVALAALGQAGAAVQRRPRLELTPAHVTRIGPVRTDRWSWDARGLPDHPAVAVYRDAPHRRAAIGTPEEHERLEAELRARGT